MKQNYYIDMIKITLALEEESELLEKLIENNKLNPDLIERYVDFLSDLFIKYGLKEDDEPNSVGFIIEDLVNYCLKLLYANEKEE